jgi:hypothetical protein
MRRPWWRLAAGAVLLLVAGLLAWGLVRQASDDAHPIQLANARACPLTPPVGTLTGGGCSGSRSVADQSFGVLANAPCACDGPGQPLRIGKAHFTLGSRAWSACVARGPGFTMETNPAGFFLRYQIPKGWTAFARSDGKRQGCWMIPNSQVDSANPERLLDRAKWPASYFR